MECDLVGEWVARNWGSDARLGGVWISKMLNVCFILSFWMEFVFVLWLLMVCDWLCGCVPCLWYPRKENMPRAYYYYLKQSLLVNLYMEASTYKLDNVYWKYIDVIWLIYGGLHIILIFFDTFLELLSRSFSATGKSM